MAVVDVCQTAWGLHKKGRKRRRQGGGEFLEELEGEAVVDDEDSTGGLSQLPSLRQCMCGTGNCSQICHMVRSKE